MKIRVSTTILELTIAFSIDSIHHKPLNPLQSIPQSKKYEHSKSFTHRSHFIPVGILYICSGGKFRPPSSLIALWMESVSGNTELVRCQREMPEPGNATPNGGRGSVGPFFREAETMGLEIRRILSLLDILWSGRSSWIHFWGSFWQDRTSVQKTAFRSKVHPPGGIFQIVRAKRNG